MNYPGYVEIGDDKHAYSVVLPDFPGCYAASDEESGLNDAVQEAVEVHLEGEEFELPTPSKIADLRKDSRFDYDGVWVLFDIDVSKLSTKHKRINITVPEFALHIIDKAANGAGVSRSEFLTQSALERSVILSVKSNQRAGAPNDSNIVE